MTGSLSSYNSHGGASRTGNGYCAHRNPPAHKPPHSALSGLRKEPATVVCGDRHFVPYKKFQHSVPIARPTEMTVEAPHILNTFDAYEGIYIPMSLCRKLRNSSEDLYLLRYNAVRSVHFQRTTRRYIPEQKTLQNHRCENLKSHKEIHVLISLWSI
jgi:hypothetical protein